MGDGTGSPGGYRDLVVAVDGPSGAGKSSVSRGVAARLQLRYLDTGSTYRALTWWLLEHGVDVSDPAAVAAAAERPGIEVGTDPAVPAICVNGTDVAQQIREQPVTSAVSAVSAVPAVRARLAGLQREVIGAGGIVVEGRDIGTVVAPDAHVKVYLTASPEARAARRTAELPGPAGAGAERTLADLQRRDRIDSTRAAAPLAKAPDAHEVDATLLTLDEVIHAVVHLVDEVRGPAGATRR